jgi:lipopolysaccharide transport system permease protein
MAGIIQGFRWSLFGGETPENTMYLSFLMVFVLLITGLIYFRRIEDEMADLV